MKCHRHVATVLACACVLTLIFSSNLIAWSLDDLLEEYEEIVIVTASKKEQKLMDAPSAVTAITADDIKAYGANNLIEALRLVPGLEIIQSSDYSYQVSIRGFNRTQYNTSNKVLWLINGRSVYSDAYGGLNAQAVNVAVDEIERIEVIRGVGSALWGANAFTGIVNIITKSPHELTGLFVKAAGGNLGQIHSNMRFGLKTADDKLAVKMSVMYDKAEQKEERFNDLPPEEFQQKLDLGYVEDDNNLYDVKAANLGLTYDLSETADINLYGGFVDSDVDYFPILPMRHTQKDFFFQADYKDTENSIRFYYNGQRDWRNETYQNMNRTPTTHPYLVEMGREQYETSEFWDIDLSTIDLEAQRDMVFGDQAELIVGASFRHNQMEGPLFNIDTDRSEQTENLYAAYAQVEYQPTDKLTLAAGARFDHHEVVGDNVNPKFSMVFKPKKNQSIRLGAGTATRNPSLADMYFQSAIRVGNLGRISQAFAAQGLQVDPIYNLTAESNYALGFVFGNDDDIEAEKVSSLEMGYQWNPIRALQLDVDLFYSQMTDAILFVRNDQPDLIDTIENVYDIFPDEVVPDAVLQGLGIPNTIDQETMPQLIAALEAAGDPALAPIIQAMQALNSVYGIPKAVFLPVRNSDQDITYYGGELSFNYVFSANITVTGNYSYMKFQDADEITTFPASPEHKFNLGLKFNRDAFYGGVVFSYMSETDPIPDDDDVGHWAEARENLNINLGYQC